MLTPMPRSQLLCMRHRHGKSPRCKHLDCLRMTEDMLWWNNPLQCCQKWRECRSLTCGNHGTLKHHKCVQICRQIHFLVANDNNINLNRQTWCTSSSTHCSCQWGHMRGFHKWTSSSLQKLLIMPAHAWWNDVPNQSKIPNLDCLEWDQFLLQSKKKPQANLQTHCQLYPWCFEMHHAVNKEVGHIKLLSDAAAAAAAVAAAAAIIEAAAAAAALLLWLVPWRMAWCLVVFPYDGLIGPNWWRAKWWHNMQWTNKIKKSHLDAINTSCKTSTAMSPTRAQRCYRSVIVMHTRYHKREWKNHVQSIYLADHDTKSMRMNSMMAPKRGITVPGLRKQNGMTNNITNVQVQHLPTSNSARNHSLTLHYLRAAPRSSNYMRDLDSRLILKN